MGQHLTAATYDFLHVDAQMLDLTLQRTVSSCQPLRKGCAANTET
jgi:hypothetical protein